MESMKVEQLIAQAGRTSGTVNSRESINASNAVRKMLKDALPGCTIHHSTGHFYCCGFIRRGEKYVYYSFSDYRYFGANPMVRTATNDKDYTGGRNVNCSISTIVETIKSQLNVEHVAHLGGL
jgi:hypothetical protein